VPSHKLELGNIREGTGEATVFNQEGVVADIAASRGLVDFKQAALLFDSIAILRTQEGEVDSKTQKSSVFGIPPGEIEWLVERGILSFETDPSDHLFSSQDPSLQKYSAYRSASLGHVCLLGGPPLEAAIRCAANFVTRYSASIKQDRNDRTRYVPLMFDGKHELSEIGAEFDFPYSREPDVKYDQAAALILTKVPIPGELTPWEAILEIRQNEESNLAFRSLREWTNDIVRSKMSALELREKIEHETAKIEREMQRLKLKYRMDVLETVVISATEFVENCLKLKPSAALKALFTVRKTRLSLLEAESKLAERGPYYLTNLKRTFSN
jgi:hypothetical protein